MTHRFSMLIAAISLGLLLAALAQAADLSGKYQGDKLNLDLTSSGQDNYTGTIHLGPQNFPVTAHATNSHLEGTFDSGGRKFPFTADLQGDSLTLATAGTNYSMQRPATAANPLAGNPAPQNPLAAPAAAPAPSAHTTASKYTVLASNDSGKTLFVQRTDLKTAQDALQCAMSDLASLLDARPTLTKAFADAKDSHQGMAAFTGKAKGAPVKGNIICGVGDNGAAITIIFASDNAPPADVAALVNAMPSDNKMSEVQLPNNLGTIDVAQGWKVQSVGQLGNIKIVGPSNQMLDIGDGLEMNAPGSMGDQMTQRAIAQARMTGQPIPPHLMVAPFSGPVDAIKNIFPQLDQISQTSGGPPVTLDQINKTTPGKAVTPNGQAVYIDYNWTKGTGDSAQHMHCWGEYETYPLGPQGWGMLFTALEGPEATFTNDQPLMLKMANSAKINQQAIAQNSQAALQKQKQWFNNFEAGQKAKSDAFDSYMKSTQDQQLVRERSNTDFDEIIRGYRDVEDTNTGSKTAVDLGNVDGVVNKLNEADPGRYKEIPLRDEMYPLPGTDGN